MSNAAHWVPLLGWSSPAIPAGCENTPTFSLRRSAPQFLLSTFSIYLGAMIRRLSRKFTMPQPVAIQWLRSDIAMKFEVGQIWRSSADSTMQAKVIDITDDGLHATLRRITHGMGTFQLDVSMILAGFQKWQLCRQ